jgi:putative ATP-dependent endonuclease of OLD family
VKIRRLELRNFRGVESGEVKFQGNTLLVGGNNAGKSTVCEALDLLLGPERLYRRPTVDEHDFFKNRYLSDDGTVVPIELRCVLTDLTGEAQRRFGSHCRRWSLSESTFVDEDGPADDGADADGVVWALPILFRARYDAEEDDFEADTFFDHPVPPADDLDEEEIASLGEGRNVFTRAHKRICGFLFLRTLRTGSRALGLQRGSLLDTVLRLGDEGVAEMWSDTLSRLGSLDPAIGDVESLRAVLEGVRDRMAKFVNLASDEQSTAFFASDLTREHLREVVRLFIATEPSAYPVPFSRQGTGSINLLVFALLTLIADLKEQHSVIFAMEEPEIALPPHTQRRVTRYVLKEMGQTIVTSHSPYVIEQFEPEEIVMLHHSNPGQLKGVPIDPAGVKPKNYRSQRRQFAEAILSRAVLVVEGETEASVFPAVSSALEALLPDYTHIDLSGVTVFTAHGDGDVPRYGPILQSLGKGCFATYDKQSDSMDADAVSNLSSYDESWESPEDGIERLLVKQIPVEVQRRFLESVSTREDYPAKVPFRSDIEDDAIPDVTFKVLRARKGEAWGYASRLIEECRGIDELPVFLVAILQTIDAGLGTRNEPGEAAAASNEPLPEEPDPEA